MSLPIYLGADHAGFVLKEAVRVWLKARDISVVDLSPMLIEDDDYPLIAQQVAKRVQSGEGEGLLICGSGLGVCIAANRFPGVLAIVARTVDDARRGREHNHANVLCLGGRVTSVEEATKIVTTWLQTKPLDEERHVRRAKEIDQI